jgi:Protein of unknown function (DUF3684)
LRSATLTKDDLKKLLNTRYLPAAGDSSRTYAPSELYLPNQSFKIFPFAKQLQWPSEPEVTPHSPNGKFLLQLGLQSMPSLTSVLTFLSKEVKDEPTRIKILDFVAERLGPKGVYQNEYSLMGYSHRRGYLILPCIQKDPLAAKPTGAVLHSPVSCYSQVECAVMGFPVIDPGLGKNGRLYGSLFQCSLEPKATQLLHQLNFLVQEAKKVLKSGVAKDDVDRISMCFDTFFKFLSHKSSEFDANAMNALKKESFIPCNVDGRMQWFRPDQVFFRQADGEPDEITERLFQLVEFSPFLAAAGGKYIYALNLIRASCALH